MTDFESRSDVPWNAANHFVRKLYLPEGITMKIVMDNTKYVTASIDEVLVTIAETTLLVILVMFLFLQNFRAVIIPALTIPISLLGTFAVMRLLGFSINLLTLFG